MVNTITHFFTVSHITALTALKQIDREFEAVSASLKVPFWNTYRRVDGADLPASDPSTSAVYLFINAMTAVVRRVFLYGAHHQARLRFRSFHMDESGLHVAGQQPEWPRDRFCDRDGVKVPAPLSTLPPRGRFQAWRRKRLRPPRLVDGPGIRHQGPRRLRGRLPGPFAALLDAAEG